MVSAWNRARSSFSLLKIKNNGNTSNANTTIDKNDSNSLNDKEQDTQQTKQQKPKQAISVDDDSSDAKKDNLFNHPLFYIWSFVIILFITMLSFFASFLVYKNK